jgi:FG-GAP-like repeat
MESGPVPATDFEFYIFGENFTQQSQILVDGQPAPSTGFLSSTALKAEFAFNVASVIGTHQLTVKDGSQTSNARSFTAYLPQQGPFVMDAIPSYFVAEDDNPTFFAMADINGDGLADVIMPGAPGNTVILYGRPDSTLTVNQTLVGLSPWSLAVGDVDGNGTADLVAC